MTRPGDQEGFALITAIMILVVLIGLGLGLVMFTNNQQRAATTEQSRESAFSLAEAALNAQVFQLARQWPTEKSPAPTSCTEATATSTNACPDPGSLNTAAGYPAAGSCAGTEAWGSVLTNRWTTYVRSDTSTSQLFNSGVARTNPAYDNGDRSVWVRAVGVSRCKSVAVISKVSEQLIPLPFPKSVLTANGFATATSGSKIVINTLGTAKEPAPVSVRCQSPLTTTTKPSCKEYTKGIQVSPDTTTVCTTCSSSILTATQLESLKSQAQVNGTYFKAGTCPASMSALTGAVTYVEGACTLSFTGGEANSKASPGFLVLYNGTLSIGGNAVFYGGVYAVNAQKSSKEVVLSQGTGGVVGTIAVDGLGTVKLGASAPNLVYDPTALNGLKTYGGAAPTPNTFRVLPSGQ